MKTFQSVARLIVLMALMCISHPSFSQWYANRSITRGADTAEFYLWCYWYQSQLTQWYALYHSNDNGQTISIQRKAKFSESVGQIYGDAAPGTLFQIPFHSVDSIGVSFDTGQTFQGKFSPIVMVGAAGCLPGELYVARYSLFRSSDYGDSFTCQLSVDSVYPHDVGVLPGELFGLKYPYYNGPLGLAYSNDFGQSFSVSLINFPGAPIFQYCQVHRGTQAGELFFFVLKTFDTIYIYHSYDYGQNLTLKNIIPYSIGGSDETYCTAGRAPGSVYIVRRGVCDLMFNPHTCLWIDFSRDYGVTFTTFYHEFDSTYTAVRPEPGNKDFRVFPNPTRDKLVIELSDSRNMPFDPKILSKSSTNQNGPNAVIELFDTHGIKVFEEEIPITTTRWTIDVSCWKKGLYYLRLTYNCQKVAVNKIFIQ